MTLAIGVDVGGTKVAAGVVDGEGRLLATTRQETPAHDPAATEAAVARAVEELRRDHPDVEVVGIGAAGWVDAGRSTVLFAPNLAWRNEPLRDRVAELVGLPVVVENDANAAAWAEYRYGAGRGAEYLAVVTVGTGIGCGFVLDGRLYRGRWGIAAEGGHVCVVGGGRECGCGNTGCWEQYASGRALERSDGGDRDGAEIMAAARAGDARALAAFDEVGRYLGQGLADLAAVLDPERFVIGGGVGEAGELLLRPAREAFAAFLTGAAYRPLAEIVPAALGNDAGLVGAADLARR